MGEVDRYLQIRSAHSGAHTADGSVAFVTDITGVPQAWTVPPGGGWPQQATFADDRVAAVEPSPVDPQLLVFGRDAGGNERQQLYRVRPDGAGERALAYEPTAIHRLGGFGPDGTWLLCCANRRNRVDFDLYRQDLNGGPLRLVVELHGWNTVADVAPDGRRALLVHAESSMDSDVWLVDLHSGAVDVLTPHDGAVRHGNARFGADGACVWLLSDRGGDHLQAWALELDGRRWSAFGPGDGWDVEGLDVRAGAGALTVNEAGRSRLHLFDADARRMRAEVPLPLGVASGLRLSPDGGRLAFSFSGAAHPSDVWEVDVGEARARRVTRSSTAGIDPAGFVEPELARVASFDGLEVPVWVYRPRGVARPGVVVSLHGGPEAQERPRFQPVYQYLLDSGLAVVAPNVRGSTGYGRRYASLDDRRLRMDAVTDLARVGEWVRAQPDLDGRRMAAMGGSYGGFMVLAALTSHPQLWAAGVNIVGVANFVSFLENTGAYRRRLREAEYGSLSEDREFLERISPLAHVDRIVAPLLVIHGANDPRVPVGEAEQIVERLRALGRPVECLLFDDEGHGIVKLRNRVTAYGAVAEFLARHLRDERGPRPVAGLPSSDPAG